MDKLKFKCPDCPFKGNWKAMRVHITGDCKEKDYACPFGCAFKAKFKDLKDHFKECQNVEISCDRCQQNNIKRKDKQDHDCLELLKENLA